MTYRLNLDLPDENLEVFLRNIAPKVGTIRLYYLDDHGTPGTSVNTTHKTDPAPAPESESAPVIRAKRRARKKPGKKRGSAVNQAILTAIGNDEATIKQMKLELDRAGRAPSSLSTGLAFLQKEGLIEKCGVGIYRRVHKAEPPADESPDETVEAPATDPLTAL